jgi:hypothetical protein
MGESSIKWTTNCVLFGSNYKYHKFFNYVIELGYDIEVNIGAINSKHTKTYGVTKNHGLP